MPRLRARVDSNQAEIVAGLRAAGCSVLPLHQLGRGVPDILIGTKRGNLLLEIKDGTKCPSARRLTVDEELFHAAWLGPRDVAGSLVEALGCLVRHGLTLAIDWPHLHTPPGDTRGGKTTCGAAP